MMSAEHGPYTTLARCATIAANHSKPPLIAVAGVGSAVVPLLGGRHGGNLLARRIAAVLESTAAITTAGDLVFGLGLDEPPEGYTLANPDAAKGFMAAMLRGGKISIEGDAPWLADSRSEERSVGKECVSTCSSLWSPDH